MSVLNDISYKLYKHSRCNNCGGLLTSNTCEYCRTVDKEYDSLVEELKDNISSNNTVSLNDFIGLYSLKDMNIDFVSKLLIDNKNYIEELDNVTKKENPNNEDNMVYLNLLRFDMVDKSISVRLMNEMIQDKLDFSKEEKKEVIKYFTENYASNFYKKSNFSYSNKDHCSLDDDAAGGAFWNMVFLSEKAVDESLDNKNYSEILETIFHEVTHTMQFSELGSKDPNKYSYYRLLTAKERLITSKNKEFYKENYLLNSMEVEARYCEKLLLLDYYKTHNIPLDNQEKYIEEAKKEEMLLSNEIRIINGQRTTIDEEFNKLDFTDEDFNRFPIIKTQYKKEGNRLVKKNKNEIEKDYESLVGNSEPTIQQEVLYKNLMDMAPSNDIDL